MKTKIYVAGPYSKGDVAMNVRAAIEAAEELTRQGFVPYVPHLTHFWHLMSPHSIDFWYAYDNEWLPVCDGLLRLPGVSSGADAECQLMRDLGKPVFFSLDELVNSGDEPRGQP